MRTFVTTLLALVAVPSIAAASDPPVPSGGHPRLYMTSDKLAGYKANAKNPNSVAAGLVKACQDTIDNAQDYNDRGGEDGDSWPGSAMNCAFSYLATSNDAHLTQAIKYWRAALNDDETIGDGLGCVQGVSTDWQTWAKSGNGDPPPIVLTVTHDTGYPMRWYGPDVALTYDWLYTAPGVDGGLLDQTRVCLSNWIDWYSQYGYHNDEAGANYNAGFVAAKTFGAIAIGTDGGADGHLWTEVLDDVFGKLLIGQGLANPNSAQGSPVGVMVGGDWGEGWQYGPLGVIEYAASARALEEYGAKLPEMDAWTNSLAVRSIYGMDPTLKGQWPGGDFDSDQVLQSMQADQLDAVLVGSSSDEAASWAAWLKQKSKAGTGSFIYDAFAELRSVPPADYTAQKSVPLWYLARGTRAMYIRTAWDDTAYWGVFESAPMVNSDHHHMSSSNFAFNRGKDPIIVDPSFYGCRGTLPTNAVSADSPGITGSYAPSQTPWSEADLPWARASDTAVYAARSDFSKAFIFDGMPSDVPYAHREWVFLPEGEVVTIDRVRTNSPSRFMYVDFHAKTGGTMKLSGSVASGTTGDSRVAIHGISLSGGTPKVWQPPLDTGDCYDGTCLNVRYKVDDYSVKVPGPYAVAIHAIDGLDATEAEAEVGSLNDDNFDPAPKENDGVIGAAVYRNKKQSYVVASSAQDGASSATMTYGVPGDSAGRHIVFDAPEASDKSSKVTATSMNGRCVISITAGSGGGFAGQPLMFEVDSASNACKVTESTNVTSASPPPGGGVTPIEQNPPNPSGCGCRVAESDTHVPFELFAGALFVLGLAYRRSNR